jgi:hypothetical protein
MAWETNPFASLPTIDPITGNTAISSLKAFIQPDSNSGQVQDGKRPFDLFPEITQDLFTQNSGIIRVSASLMIERNGQIMDLDRNDASVGTVGGDIFYIGGGNDTNASVSDIVVGGRGADLYEVRVEGTTAMTSINHGTTIVNDLGARTGAEQDAVLIEGIRSLHDIDFSRTRVASEGDGRTLEIDYRQYRSVDDISTVQDEVGELHAIGKLQLFNQYSLTQPNYRIEKLVVAEETDNPMAAAVKTYFLGVAEGATSDGGDVLRALQDRDSILVGEAGKADEFKIDFPSQLVSNLSDPQEVWIYGWKDAGDKITGTITKTQDSVGSDGSLKMSYKAGNATLDLYFAGTTGTTQELDLIKNKLSWS